MTKRRHSRPEMTELEPGLASNPSAPVAQESGRSDYLPVPGWGRWPQPIRGVGSRFSAREPMADQLLTSSVENSGFLRSDISSTRLTP